ncbi:hypothetical protein ACFVJH_01975 [Streptomyces decoyicus]|uniref:hypothetical protein n=1 Tax=Streptomyces decoyicus TaxID=249567 RepID=UPI00363628ED
MSKADPRADGSTGKVGRTADDGAGHETGAAQLQKVPTASHHQLCGNKNSPHKQGVLAWQWQITYYDERQPTAGHAVFALMEKDCP